MSTNNVERPRSVLYSFKFVGTALVGSLVMGLVSAFAPIPAQIAVLGVLISILAGLFVAYVEQEEARERRRADLLEKLRIPLALAHQHDLFDQYAAFAESLAALGRQTDPVLREYALIKLASINEQMRTLAQGRVAFTATETWRSVYERLLQSPDLKKYRSVAWVRTPDYWQDAPGRQSMRANYTQAQRGLMIARIVILRDNLWPDGSSLPDQSIRPWIQLQHDQGFDVFLVRESDVAAEEDLLMDFGIYGDRAVGVQELDDQARTVRFILLFDAASLRLAEDRWSRLSLYAVAYGDLLERSSSED